MTKSDYNTIKSRDTWKSSSIFAILCASMLTEMFIIYFYFFFMSNMQRKKHQMQRIIVAYETATVFTCQ